MRIDICRQKDTDRKTNRYRQKDRQTNRRTDTHRQIRTDRYIYMQTYCIWTEIGTNEDRQIPYSTDRQIHYKETAIVQTDRYRQTDC
jgi:hypothetical protein